MTVTVAPILAPEEMARTAAQMAAPWRQRAACAGRYKLMDDPGRHEEARAVCMGSCPVLADCGTWLWSLKEWEDPGGTCAGWAESDRPGHRRQIQARRRRARLHAQREDLRRRVEAEQAAAAARIEAEATKVAEESRLASLSINELITETVAALAGLFDEPAEVVDLHDVPGRKQHRVDVREADDRVRKRTA
jgi:hypothetical protein